MFLDPDILIYLAGGAFVLGYLIIHQVGLRLMLLLGTVLYVAYYATVAETPLWAAIYTSCATGAANLIGLLALLYRRSGWAVPARHRDLFGQFDHLTPGDFRALIREGRRFVTSKERVLTTEGRHNTALTYVISGQVEVRKQGERFHLPPGLFVGEVAYLLGQPASSTNILPAGSEIVEWRYADITRASRRNPRFRLALEAAISKDMATKVSLAVAPRHMNADAHPAFDSYAAAK